MHLSLGFPQFYIFIYQETKRMLGLDPSSFVLPASFAMALRSPVHCTPYEYFM